MGSTFKCWVIANFEIFMCSVVLLPISVITLIFLNMKSAIAVATVIYLLAFLFTLSVKRGAISFGRYVLMLGGVIFFMWAVKQPDTEIKDIEMCRPLIRYFWIVFPAASVIALWLAIYAANHIDEVVSRRMLYRNSNVSLYEYTWLYALDRFCNITATLVFYTALIAFIIRSVHGEVIL